MVHLLAVILDQLLFAFLSEHALALLLHHFGHLVIHQLLAHLDFVEVEHLGQCLVLHNLLLQGIMIFFGSMLGHLMFWTVLLVLPGVHVIVLLCLVALHLHFSVHAIQEDVALVTGRQLSNFEVRIPSHVRGRRGGFFFASEESGRVPSFEVAENAASLGHGVRFQIGRLVSKTTLLQQLLAFQRLGRWTCLRIHLDVRQAAAHFRSYVNRDLVENVLDFLQATGVSGQIDDFVFEVGVLALQLLGILDQQVLHVLLTLLLASFEVPGVGH